MHKMPHALYLKYMFMHYLGKSCWLPYAIVLSLYRLTHASANCCQITKSDKTLNRPICYLVNINCIESTVPISRMSTTETTHQQWVGNSETHFYRTCYWHVYVYALAFVLKSDISSKCCKNDATYNRFGNFWYTITASAFVNIQWFVHMYT